MLSIVPSSIDIGFEALGWHLPDKPTDPDALAHEARELSDDLVTATRWLFHSYGSCDTVRPVTDAHDLGLL